MDFKSKTLLSRQLAYAVLGGEHSLIGIKKSLSECLGESHSTVLPLAREVEAFYTSSPPESSLERTLIEHFKYSSALNALSQTRRLKVIKWPLSNEGSEYKTLKWGIPNFENDMRLAAALGISRNDLVWFSGRFRSNKSDMKLDHYYYKFIEKHNGNHRLLEIPKPELKRIQRLICEKILAKVPVHECAHGFVKNRSISGFAGVHVGKAVVLSLDLSDFFASIHAGRVFRIFQTLGYSKNISSYLAGACLHATPRCIVKGLPLQTQKIYDASHLPQGSPTSPVLSNLACFNLDIRLKAISKKLDFEYSRYADDLAFSSYRNKNVLTLLKYVKKIIQSEGYLINTDKIRIQRQGQRQSLCGLIINENLSISREKIKLLEAELYNCARTGPETQNRQAHQNYYSHLQGRISQVAHYSPKKAEKLWNVFDQLDWNN